MKKAFERELAVWLKGAGLTARSADGAAFAAHQRHDGAAIQAYEEAEAGATRAASAITVEAAFTQGLDMMRHTMWCAAFVAYMQRHHADLLPAPLRAKPEDAATWDELVAAAEAARTAGA